MPNSLPLWESAAEINFKDAPKASFQLRAEDGRLSSLLAHSAPSCAAPLSQAFCRALKEPLEAGADSQA